VLVEHLTRTRDGFVRATEELSESQTRFTPGEGGWSILEIVEHVALVERRIVDQMETKMPEAPAPTGERPVGQARFARLDGMVPTREQRRLTAPDTFRPNGTWPTVAAGLAAFVEARARGIALAASAGPEVVARVLVSRAWGELDLEEWLYFGSLHVERHTQQVNEIKQAPRFPKA
jgi:hypothetical protein